MRSSRLWALLLAFPFVVIVGHIVRTNAPYVRPPTLDPLPFRLDVPALATDDTRDPSSKEPPSFDGVPAEPTFGHDHVTLVVEVDARLAERFPDALSLPCDELVPGTRHAWRHGSFDFAPPDELIVRYGHGDGFVSREVELRLERSASAAGSSPSVTCGALIMDVMDGGAPRGHAWTNARGRVLLNTLDWTPGAELVVHFEVSRHEEGWGSGSSARTVSMRVP